MLAPKALGATSHEEYGEARLLGAIDIPPWELKRQLKGCGVLDEDVADSSTAALCDPEQK